MGKWKSIIHYLKPTTIYYFLNHIYYKLLNKYIYISNYNPTYQKLLLYYHLLKSFFCLPLPQPTVEVE